MFRGSMRLEGISTAYLVQASSSALTLSPSSICNHGSRSPSQPQPTAHRYRSSAVEIRDTILVRSHRQLPSISTAYRHVRWGYLRVVPPWPDNVNTIVVSRESFVSLLMLGHGDGQQGARSIRYFCAVICWVSVRHVRGRNVCFEFLDALGRTRIRAAAGCRETEFGSSVRG